MYVTLKEEIEKQIEKCAKMLRGKCIICKCKKSKSGMLVHHREYITNDVIYTNYPQNDSGRLQYYKDLEPMIRASTKRFSYICTKDHQSLTRICRFGDEKFNALCLERKRSRR